MHVLGRMLAHKTLPTLKSRVSGDEIGGRFGSIFLESDETLSTRVFTKKSEPGLFSDSQGELRQTGEQTDVAITGKGYLLIEGKRW